jgi:hypothetical protein
MEVAQSNVIQQDGAPFTAVTRVQIPAQLIQANGRVL